ncbi:helix-turn-helix transcriptional regulator [Brevundimonas sp. TWP2-3-2]|uniref:helix-turn-helix transcriptional regulator n=1 Tax=Brevundimonas sp. TWP2-3-2 TaxID=2804648 RepID=UPI003CFADF57
MNVSEKNLTYLRENEAAEMLCLSKRTLQKWRWLQTGPRYTRMGSAIRYLKSDLESFAASGVSS